jgi:hypothetical protein
MGRPRDDKEHRRDHEERFAGHHVDRMIGNDLKNVRFEPLKVKGAPRHRAGWNAKIA